MRILFLNHNVIRSGGTFLRAFHFGRELARRGHRVDLVSISPRRRFSFEREEHEGMTIHGSPDLLWGRGRTGWDPWDCLRRVLRVRGGAWDLVHAFDSRPAVILPALAAHRRGTPLVLDWADWWGRGGTIEERPTGGAVRTLIGPLETWFEEHFRSRADATTVISAALHDRAVSLGVPPDRILRLPQGSDVAGIAPGDRAAARARLGLPDAVPLFAYLGSLLRSDASLLFDAFRRVQERRAGARLVMIGSTRCRVPDDPAIVRTGFVSDEVKNDHLAAADGLLLPMKNTIASRGRWPSKLNDYLAAGRPVVATAVGECERLFAQHRIGIATADDATSFAAGMLALLDDPEASRTLGANARHLAEQELAWPHLARRLEAWYGTVTS